MGVTDRQVRKLMEEFQKIGKVEDSSLRAGMSRKTARKYLRTGKLPSEIKVTHTWRTRPDPFVEHWNEVRSMLAVTPELEARTLFDWLSERHPERYQQGQLRTLQRRVREWRALHGPSKEVFFPQVHVPGRIMQTDFTWMNELAVTICGVPFGHLLCHSVLTYSNWEWAVICHSESLLSLRRGLQAALTQLGRVPEEHWTDHSTAATHAIGGEGEERKFNRNYLDLMGHFGIKPRTIQVNKPNENGDVEAANGAFKRRVEQHLLLRGSRDFGSEEEYVRFFENILEKANGGRRKRLVDELAAMRTLDVALLPEYVEEDLKVSSWSTINVAGIPYSVPARLMREKVKVHRYEDKIDVFYHGVPQFTMPRLSGDGKHAINYRHVIDWLVRKPGAFRHYRYREDMFPTLQFRWAYDLLCESCSSRVADLEYLRILHHAARTMQSRVEAALDEVKMRGMIPRWELVLELAPLPRPQLPELAPLLVDLGEYDRLLTTDEVAA